MEIKNCTGSKVILVDGSYAMEFTNGETKNTLKTYVAQINSTKLLELI